jgi:hypothetical protein
LPRWAVTTVALCVLAMSALGAGLWLNHHLWVKHHRPWLYDEYRAGYAPGSRSLTPWNSTTHHVRMPPMPLTRSALGSRGAVVSTTTCRTTSMSSSGPAKTVRETCSVVPRTASTSSSTATTEAHHTAQQPAGLRAEIAHMRAQAGGHSTRFDLLPSVRSAVLGQRPPRPVLRRESHRQMILEPGHYPLQVLIRCFRDAQGQT